MGSNRPSARATLLEASNTNPRRSLRKRPEPVGAAPAPAPAKASKPTKTSKPAKTSKPPAQAKPPKPAKPAKRAKAPYTRKPKIASPAHSLRLEADAMSALRATGHVTRCGQFCADDSPAPPYNERLAHEVRYARVTCRYCREAVKLEGPFWRYGDRLEIHLRSCEGVNEDEEMEIEEGDEEKENEGEENEN